MNSNNQSSIQISPEAKFYLNIRAYFLLCDQILEIDDQLLRYLPSPIQPFRESFERLLQIPINERQARQRLSLHLTSAYFSLNEFEREAFLKQKYSVFLSKLRQIPSKVKLLLSVDSLKKPINQSLQQIDKYSSEVKQLDNQINQSIISPNQVIKSCQSSLQSLKQVSMENTAKQGKFKEKVDFSNKEEARQVFRQKQFQVERQFLQVLQWKYQACIVCSNVYLQKSHKHKIIEFIKYSKVLLKSKTVSADIVVKVYLFCLKLTIQKQSQASGHDEYVYLQLQLRKIIRQSQHQLDSRTSDDVSETLKNINQKLQHKLLNNLALNYQQPPHNSKNNPFQKTYDEFSRQFRQTIHRSQHQNAGMEEGSSIFTSNKASRYFLGQRLGSKRVSGTQSLQKIKEYQLSLRKQKLQSQVKAMNQKYATSRHEESLKTEHSRRHIHLKTKSTHQLLRSQQESRFKPEKKREQGKSSSRIYLSIKDKVSKQMTITPMGLQNEMFMIPELVYEKPKITFEEILNDTRSMQQRQNDSQTTVLYQAVSEVSLQKVQTSLSYLFIFNLEVFSFQINKPADFAQHYSCLIQTDEYSKTNIKFAQSHFFTFKGMKTLIESTDLFFELMQAGIKAFKHEPALKLAIQMKGIHEMEKKDQHGYFSHANCLNSMVQMGNYIQPYIYWYFTKQNKVNGTILSKRPKLQMSDPLKFSINLEFFKKNDFKGCLQLFQTVRNKKGLKECLTYLSQGREILCKRLMKHNRIYFVEVVEFHPKYLKKFSIQSSLELVFPVLKLYVKKYSLTDQVRSKDCIIVGDVVSKMIRTGTNEKPKAIDSSDARWIGQIRKVNMKEIFSNMECNRIIINNLNKNFIKPEFVLKLIRFLQRTDENKGPPTEHRLQKNENRGSQITEHLEEEKHFKKFVSNHVDDEDAGSVTGKRKDLEEKNRQFMYEALANYIFHLAKKGIEKGDEPYQKEVKNELVDLNFLRANLIQNLAINEKLKNFQCFLLRLAEHYEESLNMSIRKTITRKIKIEPRFYQLSLHRFEKQVYLIVLRSCHSLKEWVMYVSEKIIQNLDYLTFNAHAFQSSEDFPSQNDIFDAKPPDIKIHINFAKMGSRNEESLSQISVKSMKSADINRLKKVKMYNLFDILNSQSEQFELTFMQSPYYNSLAIKRLHTEVYFSNSCSKSNVYSMSVNHNKVLFKKVIKTKQVSLKENLYIYVACSIDLMFFFWRFDIYNPCNQEKYVVFVDSWFVNEDFSESQQDHGKTHQDKFAKYAKFWISTIQSSSCFKIDFTQMFVQINQTKFKLYETFGKMTVTSYQFAEESYFSMIEDSSKDLYQLAMEKLESKSKQNIASPLTRTSGNLQLLKHNSDVCLVLLDYQKNQILESEIQQNPTHIFANIFSEYSYKQSKCFMYQNLFRRLFQKVEKNLVVLNQIQINSISLFEEQNEPF